MNKYTDDDRKNLVRGMVTVIIAGSIGYLIGRRRTPKTEIMEIRFVY